MDQNVYKSIHVPLVKLNQVQVIWILIVTSLLAYIFSWYLSSTIFFGKTFEFSALHTTVEVGGVILSLLTAFWIYKLDLINKGPSFAKRIALALVVMAIFDFFHAVSDEGNNFVWFHTLATYLGGMLFMSVWLPVKVGKNKYGNKFIFTAFLAVLFGVFCLFFQNEVPTMLKNGSFTPVANAINVVGGIFLLVSGFRFILIFLKTNKIDDLLFFLFCSLLGLSALMFEQSNLWSLTWWCWHLVRFLAILIAFTFVVKTHLSVYGKIAESERYLQFYHENLERGIKDKTKELKFKNEQLEQYTSIVSHDLQEPIKSIISLCDIVNNRHKSDLTPKTDQIFQFINQSAKRMDEMVSELLKQGRIGYDSVRSEVDCESLMQEVTQDLIKSIEDKNAIVEFNELPIITAFPAELRMLFQNLISNAIKYTSKNVQPKVLVQCVEDEGGWLFSVEDNGIGIGEGDREKIFDLFSRLHGSSVFKGLGIGLSQCKRVVELHEGEIWVESQPGEGSVFFFTIKKHE